VNNESENNGKENKSDEHNLSLIDAKNVIKYSSTSQDEKSISSNSSIIADDEDTCYDSYLSSDASENYISSSELSDSDDDDVIILINQEQDLSFLSPRKKPQEMVNAETKSHTKNYNNNVEEERRNTQAILKKESNQNKSYNELVEKNKRNVNNKNSSKNTNTEITMSTKSTNASTSSLQTSYHRMMIYLIQITFPYHQNLQLICYFLLSKNLI